MYSTDLDGDMNMDVLSASIGGGKIVWYENTDGQGTFGGDQIIISVNDARSVFSFDVDGDGDMDVLSGFSSSVVWSENLDGNGNFGSYQTISSLAAGVNEVFASDIDGDGDMDVLSSSAWTDGSKIAWYENLHPLAIQDNLQSSFSLYPNPVQETLPRN